MLNRWIEQIWAPRGSIEGDRSMGLCHEVINIVHFSSSPLFVCLHLDDTLICISQYFITLYISCSPLADAMTLVDSHVVPSQI